ncbi:hypothetical protein BDZ89DRAFT_1151722 [Hymenopellis radicata]|nr:hypothetical protein BDZ89DRAFT_1151722 [Hymenopellis radicata]
MADIFEQAKKKKGRPKGKKDGPRPEGAPQRGRPPQSHKGKEHQENGSQSVSAAEGDAEGEADDEFDEFDDIDDEVFDELDRIRELQQPRLEAEKRARENKMKAEAEAWKRRLDELRRARETPERLPFFNHISGFSQEASDSDSDTLASQNEDETLGFEGQVRSGQMTS